MLRILVFSPAIYGPSAKSLRYGPQTRLVRGMNHLALICSRFFISKRRFHLNFQFIAYLISKDGKPLFLQDYRWSCGRECDTGIFTSPENDPEELREMWTDLQMCEDPCGCS